MTRGGIFASSVRSVNDDEEIPTLFQGANYADAAHRDEIYPGDERIRANQGLTIQIHTLKVRQPNRGELIADHVPAVAVWVPAPRPAKSLRRLSCAAAILAIIAAGGTPLASQE